MSLLPVSSSPVITAEVRAIWPTFRYGLPQHCRALQNEAMYTKPLRVPVHVEVSFARRKQQTYNFPTNT